MANKKNDPSNTSSAHDIMAPRIKLINSLMGGTEALRNDRETFLPRFDAESQKGYDSRVDKSYLVNFFRRSVESLTGKPFSKKIVVGDSTPAEIVDLFEDIDRQGNNLDVFCRKSFNDALQKGITHIMVDYPDTGQSSDMPISMEAERALNAKPYFVFIPNESILAAYCEYRNGQEILTHIRIYETETERVGFEEVTYERIRVLEPGLWRLYQKDSRNKWQLFNEGVTTLDFIPLVTIYFDREDFMVARPPLEDLAHVNIAHFQATSDQNNIMTVARFPMLAGSGLNEDEADKVKIGPRQFLSSRAPDGKFYYVEHTGAAIEAGRKELKDMEEQMSILGIELLKKSGDATATAKAIDTAENLSMLQAFVLIFSDGIEAAINMASQWLGTGPAGEITINADFSLVINDPTDSASLQWARQNREISHEQYIRELQRRGTLSADYNMVTDAVMIEAEIQKDIVDQAFQQQLANEGTIPPQPTQ